MNFLCNSKLFLRLETASFLLMGIAIMLDSTEPLNVTVAGVEYPGRVITLRVIA